MSYKNLIQSCLRLRSLAILLPLLVGFIIISAGRSSSLVEAGDVLESAGGAQAAEASDPATKALNEGRAAIASKNWARAAEKFNEVIRLYPQSEHVDASLYWLGFALKKQDMPQEAYDTLMRLITNYPRSSWVIDARSLQMELALTLKKNDLILEGARNADNDQVKIAALHSLFQVDSSEATRIVTDIIKPSSNAAPDIKERAAMLLGRYGDRQARAILIDFINKETDPDIRRRAILSIGMSEDESVLDLLKEMAINSTDPDTTEAVLVAITAVESPRARVVLRELEKRGISVWNLKKRNQ
jgi:tetratricopeptide (TPR) repeat protein